MGSACLTLTKVVRQKQAFLEDLVIFLAQDGNEELFDFLKKDIANQNGIQAKNKTGSTEAYSGEPGINLIVYGAPGAGKSHYIESIVNEENTIRTVFHPEYQHSDFVGGLRPSANVDNDVTYSFVPGPFITALLNAHENSEQHFTLIIEEINRANAAAVFGDVFQLLDRKFDGRSEYQITPDEALKTYLFKRGYPEPDRLSIPANLSLLATMNSSDQGVFLLDTAFKRRWQFHYCAVDYSQHSEKTEFNSAVVPYAGNCLSWTNFAVTLNDALKNLGIEEDRLIGPYFLSDKERKDENVCKKSIAGKLLIYLWDDVLRHGLREKIFSPNYRTFSDLVAAYTDGKKIFSLKIEDALKEFVSTNSDLEVLDTGT
jgi:hypothetical protein